ncbi:MAG: TonB-dependent receptor [Chitinophagaceae bacterium]
MNKFYLVLFLLSATAFTVAQQGDSSLLKELDNVVITATKSERKMGNLAIPTQLVTAQMIKATGSLRLQDVLQEQTGLTVVNNPLGISLAGFPNLFGAGIQMQGLDPAYTLILMDGEPLVGRNAGILKLGRVAVGNIKQIEIVKGPSSSLYGADAMAGVINIITEKPLKESADLQWQYAANNTWNMAGNYTNKFKKTGLQLFFNRYSTAGYDMDKIVYGQTVDPYTDYSAVLKLTQYISPHAQFIVSARFFGEKQRNNYMVINRSIPEPVKGTTKERDYGVNVQYVQQLKNAFKLTSAVYFNRYSNNSDVFLQKAGTLYDALRFRQQIVKPEIQIERVGKAMKYTSGAGVLQESVDASRYDSKHVFTTVYLFTQEEWRIKEGYNIIAGARLDKRNDFDWRFSPKLALSGKLSDKVFITASAGMGYRMPDARQSYALFTNSSVGYTLLGAGVLQAGLGKLKAEGQVDPAVNIGLYGNGTLKAETSTGVNLGVRYTPAEQFILQANAFRNDLRNLIDRFTLPFAKNNGQSIYSYHNVSKVYTQGLAADISLRVNSLFNVSSGYQFLIARDKDVIGNIRKSRYLKRDAVTYVTDTVTLRDYGGLLNRSRHTANAKVMYNNESLKTSAWFRINYNGRFGYTEKNGSGILDDDSEYEDGFFLCNLTITKRFHKNVEMQAGLENMFNYKNPYLFPNLPGRIFFVNLNIHFDHLINKN